MNKLVNADNAHVTFHEVVYIHNRNCLGDRKINVSGNRETFCRVQKEVGHIIIIPRLYLKVV